MTAELSEFDISSMHENRVCFFVGSPVGCKTAFVKQIYESRKRPNRSIFMSRSLKKRQMFSSTVDETSDWNLDRLGEILTEQQSQRSYDSKSRAAIIVDPVDQSLQRFCKIPTIRTFCLNIRFLRTGLYFTEDTPRKLHPSIRSSVDYVFIFDCSSDSYKTLYHNYGHAFPTLADFVQVLKSFVEGG